MAKYLNISLKTIRRKLSELDCVKYVGSGYSGHWEIEEQPYLTSATNAGVFDCLAVA